MDDYLELERFSLDGEVLYNDLVFKYFAGSCKSCLKF